VVRAVRRELRAFPSRLAPKLFGKPQGEIAQILRMAVKELSAVLSDGVSPVKETNSNGTK
jgi:hypothetical protein